MSIHLLEFGGQSQFLYENQQPLILCSQDFQFSTDATSTFDRLNLDFNTTETPMGIQDKRLKVIPARRAGKPEEIAAAVFLASDELDYIQGAEIKVDGAKAVLKIKVTVIKMHGN